MPRLDHQLTVETVLTREQRLLLDVLLQHINVLRVALSLPPLTNQQVRAAVRQWMREHPGGGT